MTITLGWLVATVASAAMAGFIAGYHMADRLREQEQDVRVRGAKNARRLMKAGNIERADRILAILEGEP